MRLPIGLSEQTVRSISQFKNEPQWMLDIRLSAYREFKRLPIPSDDPILGGIDFNGLCYFDTSTKTPADRWSKIPTEIKDIYQKNWATPGRATLFSRITGTI